MSAAKAEMEMEMGMGMEMERRAGKVEENLGKERESVVENDDGSIALRPNHTMNLVASATKMRERLDQLIK